MRFSASADPEKTVDLRRSGAVQRSSTPLSACVSTKVRSCADLHEHVDQQVMRGQIRAGQPGPEPFNAVGSAPLLPICSPTAYPDATACGGHRSTTGHGDPPARIAATY